MTDIYPPDELAAGEIARYAWGYYKINIARDVADQDPSFVSHAILQLSERRGHWSNEQAFLSFISLAHEFVHFRQDVSTGLGHWDMLAREHYIRAVQEKARLASWCSRLPIDSATRDKLIDEFGRASLVNAYGARSQQALASIRAELQVGGAELAPGTESIFDIVSLLELDAVLSVQDSVSNLYVTPEADALCSANEHVWKPAVMTSAYRLPYEQIVHAVAKLARLDDAEPMEKVVERVADIIPVLGPMLLDIAFAHPAPDYFTGARVHDRPHFEPGVRLIRVLRTLHSTNEMFTPGDDITVFIERLQRSAAEYQYPSMRSTYETWAEVFDKKSQGDAIAALRRDLCRERLKSPHAIERRTLLDFVSLDIPLMLESPGWKESRRRVLTKRSFTDGGALDRRIAAEHTFLQITRWELGLSPQTGFQCPLADNAWLCPAAETVCRTGIAQLRQFPADRSTCYVRHWLEDSCFNMGQFA
jgi:hypothetical protein